MAIADVSEKSIEKLICLKGKTAVVTGGARGIGLAIAQRLMEAGANILIADHDVDGSLGDAVAGLKYDGRAALGFKYDVRNASEMNHIAAEAVNQFDSLDIWVNDAGIYPSNPVDEISETELDAVWDTNIKGVFYGSRAAIKHMKENKRGVILNITSVSGFQGAEFQTHYNASKFAVRGMIAGFAKELGEYNIRVVGIAPTWVETPGIKEEKPKMDKLAGTDSREEQEENIPLGRVAEPDDIARVALFLVSDLAGFVSGTTVIVDGGELALG